MYKKSYCYRHSIQLLSFVSFLPMAPLFTSLGKLFLKPVTNIGFLISTITSIVFTVAMHRDGKETKLM